MYEPNIIEVRTPLMGGKCWLLERKGLFVLEQGPGTVRTLAVTHAGSGNLEVIDGIPNADGFFPDEDVSEPDAFNQDEYHRLMYAREHQSANDDDIQAKIEQHRAWGSRRGRRFYQATPAVMGSWMLDAGFIHGLTIRATGAASAVNTFASIVWMPFKARAPSK